MSTGVRHYWHGQLVRRACKPGHTLTVRFLSPSPASPRVAPSIEDQLASARATADGYRRRAAVAGRPVHQIQMQKFAETWDAKVRQLEAELRRLKQGELFTGGTPP